MRGVLISVQAQSRIALLRSLLVAAFLIPSATLAINIHAQTLDARAEALVNCPILVQLAFALALEKCRGDGECYPLSDRIDDGLDLPRHLRSDRSLNSDFPSPSAQPSVMFPDRPWGALPFDGISTHQTCSR
jgi:hypothetical protein